MTDYYGRRYATAEEIADYERIEALTDSENFPVGEAVEIIGNLVFSYGKEHRSAYAKAYRFAKKYGETVNAFVNWYCTEG